MMRICCVDRMIRDDVIQWLKTEDAMPGETLSVTGVPNKALQRTQKDRAAELKRSLRGTES